MKHDEIKERVGKVAELLKLSAMLNKKPDELSGGQQQRTALALSLIHISEPTRPRLISYAVFCLKKK